MKLNPVLLACTMSAILSIAVSGQNLVVNGSFEEGTDGWTFLGSWTIEQIEDRAVGPDSGTNFATSLALNVQPVYQDIPTMPGQMYRISAAAAGNRGLLGVYWGGVLVGNVNVARADGDFFRDHWDVTANSDMTRLLLQPPGLPAPQVFFVDSVSVTPVPEPSSTILLGAALLAGSRQFSAVRNS
jgi:hypothetical protein